MQIYKNQFDKCNSLLVNIFVFVFAFCLHVDNDQEPFVTFAFE